MDILRHLRTKKKERADFDSLRVNVNARNALGRIAAINHQTQPVTAFSPLEANAIASSDNVIDATKLFCQKESVHPVHQTGSVKIIKNPTPNKIFDQDAG